MSILAVAVVARVLPFRKGQRVRVACTAEEQAADDHSEALRDYSHTLIESAPVGIITTDAAGVIVTMNNAAERLTLYRKGELLGTHSLLVLLDPKEVAVHAQRVSADLGKDFRADFTALTARLGTDGIDEQEWSYIRRDGTRAWVHVTLNTIRDETGAVSGYVSTAFDLTERKRLADDAHYMAHHDQLTGLLNRTVLEERIEAGMQHAARARGSMAIFLIDIDRFKRINDSLGHRGGDAVIVHVAKQLRANIRSTDTAVRIGGDEFVVILPGVEGADNAARRAKTILDQIGTSCDICGRDVKVTATMGVCLYPGGGNSSAELLSHADVAMYAAKRMGRGSFQVFSQAMQREKEDRIALQEELREAVHQGQLLLHYQPQLSMETGLVYGLEMLLRWKHPYRGFIPPDVFIPVAEEAGLMAQIAEWSLRRACTEGVALRKQLGRHLCIAVNFSPHQLQQPQLADTVREALADSGLPPEDLELEITEQNLMDAQSSGIETLDAIRKLGVSLAIDDFGTGFSSFSYILQYNVDRLKIDRSFVAKLPAEPGAAAIVRTIIAMAHGLGMKVCAEGVETTAQAEFLARRHCDGVQGYLYAKPVPFEYVSAAIEEAEGRKQTRFWLRTEMETRVKMPEPFETRNSVLKDKVAA